jgi:type IV pilus assembly protein PilY1
MNSVKHKKHLNAKGLLLGVAVFWGMVSMTTVWADIPAQAPLFISTSLGPNILFILDDSDSMNEAYLPESVATMTWTDAAGNDNGVLDGAALSAAVNTLYYDPTITYVPPVYADGTPFPNAQFTAAMMDGYGLFESPVNSATVNLATSYQPSWSDLTAGGVFTSYYGAGLAPAPQPAYYYVLKAGCSNIYFGDQAVDSSGNGIGDSSVCYDKIVVSATSAPSGVDGYTNFANWYSYYRNRIMMAKAGISRAFAQLGSTPRVGYGRLSMIPQPGYPPPPLHNIDGVTMTTVERGVRAFSGADRKAFFYWLFAIQPTGLTPSRLALDAAGQYYSSEGTSGPWSSTPGNDGSNSKDGALLACRQSYTVFMTDGYWNDNGFTGTAHGNNDGTPGTTITGPPTITEPGGATFTYSPTSPFTDSYSNTLADIAMYYWKNDLCPLHILNEVPTSTLDPAFWQHMVTYGIGLGVPPAIDPVAAFSAIGTGAAITRCETGVE